MPRREYRSTFRCAEPGCKEVQFYVHDTRADQNAAYKRQNEHPFKCTRHAHPEQNLRPGNLTTRHVLVATLVNDRFLSWHEDGKDRSGSGFAFGPGFNAHADDFPEGTRLTVTARIELPEDAAEHCRKCPAPASCSEFGRCTLEQDSSPLAAKDGDPR